jgi:hypothetical protein
MEQRFTDVAALRAYHVPCESRFDADLYKLPSGRNMKMGMQAEMQAKSTIMAAEQVDGQFVRQGDAFRDVPGASGIDRLARVGGKALRLARRNARTPASRLGVVACHITDVRVHRVHHRAVPANSPEGTERRELDVYRYQEP